MFSSNFSKILSVSGICALSLFLFAYLAGCTEDSGGDDADAGSKDAAAKDAAADSGDGVDSVSAATPEVDSAKLGEAHSGWGISNCLKCHVDQHNAAGYRPGQCATCHGSNGAPPRIKGHDNASCLPCHDDRHTDYEHKAPDDCRACHMYDPPAGNECSATETFDVVVIGAGGGGLSAGAFLSQLGFNVVVLEKHYKVGGYMVNFNRGDYRFEASLHAMDGLDSTPFDIAGLDTTRGMNVDTFKALGIWDKVEPLRTDWMYRLNYPDKEFQFDVPADIDEYMKLLQEKFPHEADGIDSMFKDLMDVEAVMRLIMKYKAEGKDIEGEHLQEFTDEISDKGLVEQLMLVQEYMESTTLSEFIAKYISDEKLITIWTQLAGFSGAEPDKVSALFFMVMWNSYHVGGYYYFKGGSQAVSDAQAEVIVENDGEIRLNSLVTKIDIEDGIAVRVRTADGVCYETQYVISNANAPSTLLDMIGEEYMPTDDAESPYHPDRIKRGKEDSMKIGMPAFQVCLGVDHDYYEYFGDVHEVMFTDSYSQEENFDYFMDSDIEKAPYAIANYGVLDPAVAPPGKNAICLTSMLMYDWMDEWYWNESHQKYADFAYDIGWKLVERAEADYLPGLTQYVEVMEVGSPLTLKGFTLNPRGTIFGWDTVPEQSMNKRMPNQTPIDNVLLSGAWTFPGGGQSAVITSGLLVGQMILEKEAAIEK